MAGIDRSTERWVRSFLKRRRGIDPSQVDDLDRIGMPGCHEYMGDTTYNSAWARFIVRRPFPAFYIETVVSLPAGGQASFQLYQADTRAAPNTFTTNAQGAAAIDDGARLVLRKMPNAPQRDLTQPAGTNGPTIMAQLLPADIILYPDVWYFLGISYSFTDPLTVSALSDRYGPSMTFDSGGLRFPAILLSPFNSWPNTLAINLAGAGELAPLDNQRVMPAAAYIYTRRGMLRHRNT